MWCIGAACCSLASQARHRHRLRDVRGPRALHPRRRRRRLGPCSCSRGRAVAWSPICCRSQAASLGTAQPVRLSRVAPCGADALSCAALPSLSCAALPRCPLPHDRIVRSLSGARWNCMGRQPGWMPSRSDGAGRAVAFGRRMQPHARRRVRRRDALRHPRAALPAQGPESEHVAESLNTSAVSPAPFHCSTHSTKQTHLEFAPVPPRCECAAPQAEARTDGSARCVAMRARTPGKAERADRAGCMIGSRN